MATTLQALSAVLLIGVLAGCFAPAEEPEPDTSPLFYEITAPDGEVEGWMLGTIHLLPDDVVWQTDRIEKVVDEADLLMVEIADLGNTREIGQIFVELGTTRGMPAITQRVKPSERPALLDQIERAGFSPSDFSAIETWAAALMLAQGNAIGEAENGVDRVIMSEFSDREIVEFEGALAQLTIFDRLAEVDQRVLLSNTIIEPGDAEKEAEQLVRAWLTGDVDAIEKLTTTGAMEDREVRNALLVDRNTAWMNKLTRLLRTPEKPLVAVGAAHLVGPDGLPALLEKRGYTVRRLGP
jgi:hypothetical protein